MLLAAGGVPPAAGQEVIPDRETCPRCNLELREVRRLGDQPGQELYPDVHRWLVEDAAGRIWVPNVSSGTEHLIQVYDTTGRYVDFSRRGEGPGEFERVSLLACFDGWILHQQRTRFSRIDPMEEEMTFLFNNDEVGFQYAAGAVQLSDSRLWVASPSRHPDYLGYPILELDVGEGRVTNAYGKDVEHFDREVQRSVTRFPVRLDSGRIASVGQFSYEIRIRARNGHLLRHFVRDAPWFRPDDEDNDPPVTVGGVVSLGPHTIAVMLWIGEEGVERGFEGAGRDRTLDQRNNGILEVLDLRQGEVLRRIDMPHPPVGAICPTNRIAALALSDHAPIDHLRIYDLEWEDDRR